MLRILFGVVKLFFAVALLVGVSVGLLAGYRWVTTTQLLALERIQVRGNQILSAEGVRDLAGVAPGQNIFALELGRVQQHLSSSGWIESVVVRRRLPNTLVLEIEEREPVFWVKKGNTVFYADQRGRAIAPVRAGRFISLPYLEAQEPQKQYKRELGILCSRLRQGTLPFNLSQIGWIRFFPGEVVEIHLLDRSLRIRLGEKALRRNLSYLDAVWRDLQDRQELARVERILIYNATGWVRSGPRESL